MLTGLSLRLRIFLIFVGLTAGILLSIAAGAFITARQLENFGLVIGGATLSGFGVLGLLVWVWFLFDQNVARPIETLAGGLRTGSVPDPEEGIYLADLGPATRAAAEARTRETERLSEAVRLHADDLTREKSMLESILSDIGAAAVMVDQRGRVMFYNAAASRMMPGLGLNRDLARALRTGAVDAARARLRVVEAAGYGSADAPPAATGLVCFTQTGDRLSGLMRALSDERGHILILRAAKSPAAQASADGTETLRRSAASLVPLLSELDGPVPPAVAKAIRSEASRLAGALRALTPPEMAETQDQGRVGAAELIGSVTGVAETEYAGELTLAVDGGTLAALVSDLAARLVASGRPAPRLTLDDEGHEAGAQIRLSWQGEVLPVAELDQWLDQPSDPDRPDQTGADLLAEMGTSIWPESDDHGRAALVLPLPLAASDRDHAPGLTYDFGLTEQDGDHGLLSGLTCVVFDTETTGLGPTDRIVQIAGLRITNGRLTGERFETLVNPGRPIPAVSTDVHGITDAMVADAPDTGDALHRFHEFADGAVLVAHNAPFDMGFLHAARAESRVAFDNRVMDTVLLSAMVWGQAVSHSLDALTARLGIEIPPELRHTAMGDAEATAEAFLRLLPALAAKGIARFDDMSAAAAKHRRLLADANLCRPDDHAPETQDH
ncbi:3'-5' exonuclease [Pontibaca salina]|uniref:DNA-directed DNA polymerase n=1 Tax=Pontibaca salina TaxID=2795731 RepID=A0A934HRT5_9RHOB|nr:3'-5' exonuclease [Pontibaca salina]MBI6629033.1 3'-5' exonuclease [Pontibaca salina]